MPKPAAAPHPETLARIDPIAAVPVFPSSFIGRETELAQVAQSLRTARLLTLTGPGGSGKTRLAYRAATQLGPDFRDGVWWCDLAAVTDPAYLAQTLASDLRLSQPAERPPLEAITEALRLRQALLVLDNCEHVLASCAALALALLQACPDLTILATSLQPLGLLQEQVWPVPPLALPAADESDWARVAATDAVRLFIERGAHARPSFRQTSDNQAAIVAICRRLDGLPLALELAAARLRLLTVEQIAQRLDNAFSLLTRGSFSPLPRHQTLRLVLDWSVQFLASDELCLLQRLAVFAGPFTLSMAEAVCGAGWGQAVVLNLLDGLTDKSFVALLPADGPGEPQCRLLELIRQYAREGLEGSGEAADVRDRYLNWCAAWAEAAAGQLTGPGRGGWLAQFEQRQEHFRAALRWACTGQRSAAGLRLANALGRFWMTGGLAEGRGWLEELLALEATAQNVGEPPAGRTASQTVRAWALLYVGRLAVRQGDAAYGLRRGQESLTLFQAAHETAGQLAALNLLALATQDTGDYPRAQARYREALDLSRQTGNERMTSVLLVNQGLMFYEQEDFRRAAPIWTEAYALIERLNDTSIASRDNLACLAMMQGDLARAHSLLEEELGRQGKTGDPFATALVMMDLGEVSRRQGDFDQAENWLRQALERQQQVGDRYRNGETLVYLAALARNREDWPAAAAYSAQSLPMLESTGYTRMISQAKIELGLQAAAQKQSEAALAFFRAALQVAQRGHHRLCQVEALEGAAGVLAGHAALPADRVRAARWLAAAQAARQDLGAPLPPVEHARLDDLAHRLRTTLARPMGAADGDLDLEPIIAEALVTAGSPAPPTLVEAPPTTTPGAARLHVLALGPTHVLVGDRAVAPGDWTYAKSRELLFYLLAHGPTSKAQIGLDLWPEASPAQLRAAFHSALHHLRRALGRADWVVHTEGQYAVNGNLPLDYDVPVFENHLSQSQPMAGSGGPPAGPVAAMAHLEAAVALWRGDFLAGVEMGDWAMYRREALRQAFLDGVLRLAELRFAAARYAVAADAFRQALALDSYLELAHRGLMRCFARQGEGSLAVRHFLNLQRLLHTDLRAVPSPETTLLYDRIRRGDNI